MTSVVSLEKGDLSFAVDCPLPLKGPKVLSVPQESKKKKGKNDNLTHQRTQKIFVTGEAKS